MAVDRVYFAETSTCLSGVRCWSEQRDWLSFMDIVRDPVFYPKYKLLVQRVPHNHVRWAYILAFAIAELKTNISSLYCSFPLGPNLLCEQYRCADCPARRLGIPQIPQGTTSIKYCGIAHGNRDSLKYLQVEYCKAYEEL